MTKHALNAFLATSVTFINEIAALCERVGRRRQGGRARPEDGAPHRPARLPVARRRVRRRHARARRRVPARARARARPADAARSTASLASNTRAPHWAQRRLAQRAGRDCAGRRVAVWGLTYKPGTDTLRRSAAVELCRWLRRAGRRTCTRTIRRCRTLPADLVGASTRRDDPLDAAAARGRSGRRHRMARSTATLAADASRGGMRRAGSCSTRTAFCADCSAATRASGSSWRSGSRRDMSRCRSPAATRHHHRRQPGPRPRDRARVRRGRRQRAACARATRRAGRGAGDELALRAAPASRSSRERGRRLEPRRRRRARRRGRSTSFGGSHILVNNAGVYGPMGADRGGRLGRVGARDRDQPLRLGAAVPRAAAALQARSATARSSSCPAAARPTRCRASAPTPRRRRRSSASPRRWRSRCRTFGIDVNAIAPGALNTRLLDEVLAAGPGRGRARTFYERMVKTKATGRHAARDAAPRSRSSSAPRRATASPAGCSARCGIPGSDLAGHRDDLDRHRRLHAAPHRPEGPRHRRGATR